MTERELPLFDDSGEPILFPSLAVWCVMHFPDDIASAKQSTIALSNEQISIQSGDQDKYSEVAHELGKRISGKTQIAILTGQVALQIQKNIKFRGSPDWEKAQWLVSERASTIKTNSGKPLPSDFRRLRASFLKYRDVAHLWAAFEALEERERADLIYDNAVFERFLLVASELENIFDKRGAMKNKYSGNWNPWRVPKRFLEQNIGVKATIDFGGEDDWVKQKLSEYKADATR